MKAWTSLLQNSQGYASSKVQLSCHPALLSFTLLEQAKYYHSHHRGAGTRSKPRTPGLISPRQYWLTTVLPGRIFPYRTCTLDYSGMLAVSIFLPCLLPSPSLVIKAFLWKHSTSCLFGHAGNSEIVLQQARCKQHPQGDPFPSPVPGSSSLTLPQAEGSCGDGPRNRPGHHIQHQKTPG